MEQQYTLDRTARLSLEGNTGKCSKEIKDSPEINQHLFSKGEMTEKYFATFDDAELSL